MDRLMPRRWKLTRPKRCAITFAVVDALRRMGLNPVVGRDARSGDRVDCHVIGNAREGEAASLTAIGYVRVLSEGAVRLAGLRSAHQSRVALALQRRGIPHRI